MPELPEVETVKNILNELVLNKEITSVDVLRKQTIDGDAKEFSLALKNKKIIGFERIGKFIIFKLSNDYVLISHLRMEGKYFLKDEKVALEKHDLVVFHFKDKTKLIYNDTRRFGKIKLSKNNSYLNEPPLNNVGPDPFMIDSVDRLAKAFKSKSIAIKTALLDQSIMSGLGNIYVDEILFETKIHPETPAKLINKKQLEEILKASKVVLTKAIEAGGSTIKSYHPKEGISGNFQVNLKVYGKGGKACSRCGHELRKIFVNGRGTTFCPKCQKNPAAPKVYGLTGPIASGKSLVSSILEKLNFKILDCDKIVHDLYKDKNIQNDLKKIIPNLTIKDNEVERLSLRQYLISNPNKKRALERYVFKKVQDVIEKEIRNSKTDVIIDAPLLFESKLDVLCDYIIYINVNKDTQIKHLQSRKSDVNSSLEINKSFEKENVKKATYIIDNNSDVANLEKQIKSIFCK